jgi:tetratricopeptide (TPR) repeat protein
MKTNFQNPKVLIFFKQNYFIKVIGLSIIVLLHSFPNFCQKTKFWDQASNFYEAKEWDKALTIYAKIHEKSKVNSPDYARAFYNMGHVKLLKKDTLEAEKIFLKILESNFNELDKGGRGSGVMQEPYALYRNNSSKILAQINIQRKDFKKALFYVELADKKYKYHHFCGNELEADRIEMATYFGKCYWGLNEFDKSMNMLLPHVFNSGLADNDDLVKLTVQYLIEKYGKAKVEAELSKSLGTVTSKTRRIGKEKYDYNECIIFGKNIELYAYFDWKDQLQTNKLNLAGNELVQESMRRSLFFKSVF